MSHVKTAMIIWSVLALGLIIYYVCLRQHVLRIQDPQGEFYGAAALTVVTLGGLLAALVIRIVTAFLHRPAAAAAISLQISLLTGALLILMVALSQVTAFTPAVEGPDPISELRSVTVNGRTEWLSLRGQDRSKPVLLFLSGGPGGSQLVTARHCFADLERDYVVVTWEQPGAAKSYSAINPADITLETYLSDGAAVTEILRREFGQNRIYLMGESWGSALGLMMAREHPEHYRAFIGTGQMVDFLETERIDYQMALEDARRTGNKKAGRQARRAETAALRVGHRPQDERLPLSAVWDVGAYRTAPWRHLLHHGRPLRGRVRPARQGGLLLGPVPDLRLRLRQALPDRPSPVRGRAADPGPHLPRPLRLQHAHQSGGGLLRTPAGAA